MQNDIKNNVQRSTFMKRTVLGIALIIIGILIISTAVYMRFSAIREQKQMLEDFQNTLSQSERNNNTTSDSEAKAENYFNSESASNSNAKGYDKEEPAEINTVTPPAKKNNTAGIKSIAVVEIPRIGLKVAVGEGTDSKTLKYALGHFKGTAMPGERGNFSLAGHRSYTYNQFLNRADEIKVGDKIKVETKKGKFEYVVNEIKVVEPTEVSVLSPTDDATITLVTCTPIRVATHRLIIKGKLVD